MRRGQWAVAHGVRRDSVCAVSADVGVVDACSEYPGWGGALLAVVYSRELFHCRGGYVLSVSTLLSYCYIPLTV